MDGFGSLTRTNKIAENYINELNNGSVPHSLKKPNFRRSRNLIDSGLSRETRFIDSGLSQETRTRFIDSGLSQETGSGLNQESKWMDLGLLHGLTKLKITYMSSKMALFHTL